MPDRHKDKEQRQDFNDYLSKIRGQIKIDETLKNLIIKYSEPLEGEILGEYIEAFRKLVEYADTKKYPYRYYDDKRKGSPFGGKYVEFTLGRERRDKPGPYSSMVLCFTRKEIYDLYIDGKSVFERENS
jgi:hypothetical protein